MAGNKFATMLHRKTNKITLVLTYALLEWILISFLLLNALFSYLITKFANFFGLKPPCLLCSRIDHILDSKKQGTGTTTRNTIITSSYNELICHQHAIEISKLGYCSSHRKLVESRRRLCEDCLFSVACDSVADNSRLDGSLMEVLRWLKVVGRGEEDGDGHDVDVRCSCCDEEVITKPAVLQLASGLDDHVALFETRNLNSIEEAEEGIRDDEESDHTGVVSAEPDKESHDHGIVVTSREEGSDTFVKDTDPRNQEESSQGFLQSEFGYEILDADVDDDEDIVMEAEKEPLLKKDSSLPPPPTAAVVDDRDPSSDETIHPQHLEFYIDNYDYRLVPVGTMDFALIAESKGEYPAGQVDEEMSRYQAQEGKDNKILGFDGGMKAELGLDPAADFVLESCDLGVNNNKSSIVSKETEDDVSNNNNKEEELEEIEAQEQFHKNNDQSTTAAPPASVTPFIEMPAGTDELQTYIPSASDITYQKSESQTDQGEFANEDSVDITSNADAVKEGEAAAAELTDQTQPLEVENPSYEVPYTVDDRQAVTEVAATVNELACEDYVSQSNNAHHESKDRLDEVLLLTDVIYTVIANAVDEAHVDVVTELAADIPSAPEDGCRTDNHGNDEDLDAETDVEEPSTPCKDESPSTLVDEEVSIGCPVLAAEDDTNDPNGGRVKEEERTEQCGNITTKAREQGGVDEEEDPIDQLLEEEQVPDTPTSVEESIDTRRTVLLGGHTDSMNEGSLDGGSIISEPEGVLGTNDATAVEYLKSALGAERKALRSLYTELEEERNAAAVAASQTLAMINRLQEERAAIEMEASQYHRMMEEQSEYDQEALQMMNELVTKREKEKEELEKEVEVYRRKVMEYEERERVRILRSRRRDGSFCSRSRTSSAHSLSNGEESSTEELLLSADLNNMEVREEEEDRGSSSCRKQQQQQQRPVVGEDGEHHDDTATATPVDAVLNLEESLAVFEDERMSILEQLKALEEKLVTLSGEEEQHIENMQPFDIFCEENANQFGKSLEYSTNNVHERNGHTNGTTHDHDHDQASSMRSSSRVNGSHPKQLLPLFDATELVYSEEDGNHEEDGCFHSMQKGMGIPLTKFELEKKRLVLEAEVDHVYDRLQALEADREFVKHCVGSLRKGDKGINLLQEILQHLRDLKNVEMKSRMNVDDVVM